MRLAGWCGLLLALGSIGGEAAAEEILWRHDTEGAWRQTVGERRPLIVFVARSRCKHCARMKSESFADPLVRELVRKEFVPLEIDADADRELAKELQITTFPTTLVISPEADLLERFKGYVPPAELQRRLNLCRVRWASAQTGGKRR